MRLAWPMDRRTDGGTEASSLSFSLHLAAHLDTQRAFPLIRMLPLYCQPETCSVSDVGVLWQKQASSAMDLQGLG